MGLGVPTNRCATNSWHREKGWRSVDSLDSVWLGMKLGVAMIGMGMMGFFWRGIWRSKRAGEQKHR